MLFTDAYRSAQSPFYQLPPKVQHYPSSQLLLSSTPPALQQLLGELTERCSRCFLGAFSFIESTGFVVKLLIEQPGLFLWHSLSAYLDYSIVSKQLLVYVVKTLFVLLSSLLSDWTDNFKVQYLQFMAHMKTPQYRSNLQQLLEQEKVTSGDRRHHGGLFLPILRITSYFFPLSVAKTQGPVRAGGAASLRLPVSQGQD